MFQIFAMLAFVVVAGGINLAWDLTYRHREARRLTEARREARPRALPISRTARVAAPVARMVDQPPSDDALARFIALTRTTFTELDQTIDRFDFLVLRARARARFGVAFVRSAEPRALAHALLERWLDAARALDAETLRVLREVALGPEAITEIIAREQARVAQEMTVETERVLTETTTDLDRAVIHLQQIVRFLESIRNDPYRVA